MNVLHDGPTSAEVIADLFLIHFFRRPWGRILPISVLDLTFGLGAFWKPYKQWWQSQIRLTTNDLFTAAGHKFDLQQKLPWESKSFDVVVFDPPFSAIGTPSDGKGEWAERYGAARNLPGAPKDYNEILGITINGVQEACRIAKHGIVVKCQPCVESAEWHHTPFEVELQLFKGGWFIDGWWLLAAGRREQPMKFIRKSTGKEVVRKLMHPRNNVSVFLVAVPLKELRT